MKKSLLFIMLASVQAAFSNPDTPQTLPQNGVNATEQAIFGVPNNPAYPYTQPQNEQPKPKKPKAIDSQELKRLFRAAQEGNVAAAERIKQAANNNNRNAALLYGYLAHTGKLPGIGTNYATAMKAYKKAARQKDKQGNEIGFYGNHLAAYNIGLMYQQGQGVPQSANEAYRWFKIANDTYQEKKSSEVFFPAAYRLATALQTGVGTQRDDKEAVKMWKAIANSNKSPEANLAYAKMALAGQGMTPNSSIAIDQLNEAAKSWNMEAMLMLIKLYEKGEGTTGKPNKVAVAKWYIVLAAASKKYKGKAAAALSALPQDDQRIAQKEANVFLNNRSILPDPFDYKVPLYENPNRQR
ncbi:MAG: sel1 repeat family protein [Neisseriaceae bacterium]|nr:sel1 repeat family protein [Neisseriaceae bacterium]MBQ9725534.1 sel1 repeat family protein [Neisseriaceae bacterium]